MEKKPYEAPKLTKLDLSDPRVKEFDKIETGRLSDPEMILRVKRRVGPSMWIAVLPVLEATQAVLKQGLDKPDPLAPRGKK